ncbi:type I polyketide synthase [Nocardia jejuensis]|uniref:type I polyketide synthase n=1 Tax=Nocardia jejuensis TaxID=328049 RepID=UPI00082B0C49|nr:type I polyketide synthase [Nocardia jejuensis]
MSQNQCADEQELIAVVGMSCRMPGAKGLAEFWQLLIDGGDAITEVPADRFDIDAAYDARPQTPGKTVSRYGGFLTDAFGFDSNFFGIAPVEARGMDPQQRLLLQLTWEALEHAGIRPSSLAGTRGGVFVGQATAEYSEQYAEPLGIRQAAGSRLRAVTAGRLSYALDVRGPSLTVDTACSSSLVAVHLARQSLLSGESDLSVAAGVNLILAPTDAITYSQGNMLSRSGRCRFGDADADGFVRSEGAGVVILQRLDDARRDANPVLAVINSSVANNDGQGSGLLLQPAVSGQREMLLRAWALAGISPADLDYVEAHGTGTTVGDGVELRALSEAIAGRRRSDRPLWVGSVKSNIGHTEAAAGIAGLIKAVMIARHRTIPASLHVKTPNPVLVGAHVQIATRTETLVPAADTAVVGVSSFGIAGTNAHVIVTEAPPAHTPHARTATPPTEPALMLLSARSQAALRALATRYAEHLETAQASTQSLHGLCARTATHRDHHRFRLWATAHDHRQMAATLREAATGLPTPNAGSGETSATSTRTVFVFPGQGSQWTGMAQGLWKASPSFRDRMRECDREIRRELGWSVIECLTADSEVPTDISILQPLLWAIQVSLVSLWKSIGVEPDLCVGHSMGEVAAAVASEALSLSDAAAVICHRSRLLNTISGAGAMLLIGLGADDAQELVDGYGEAVCVAAENSPSTTVLAGDPDILTHIACRLDRAEVLARPIRADVASHSPYTEVLRTDLIESLSAIRPQSPRIPLLSTVTAQPVSGAQLDAGYWMDNLRKPVRFTTAIQQAINDEPNSLFVEISAHPVLTRAITDIQKEAGTHPCAIATLLRDSDEHDCLATALGEIFAHGGYADWQAHFRDYAHYPADQLPTYAWDLEQYRDRPTRSTALRARQVIELPLDVSSAAVRIGHLQPIPPITFLHALTTAARSIDPDSHYRMLDVRFEQMADAHQAPSTMHITLDPIPEQGWRANVELRPRSDSRGAPHPEPVVCLTAVLAPAVSPPTAAAGQVDNALSRSTSFLTATMLRESAQRRGIFIDPTFPVPQRMWHTNDLIVGQIYAGTSTPATILESCLQPVLALLPDHTIFSPTAIEDARIPHFTGPTTGELWSITRRTRTDPDEWCFDVTIVSAHGEVVAEFRNLTLRKIPYGTSEEFIRTAPNTHDQESHPETATPLAIALREAARVLGTSTSRIDPRRSLREQGLDSLMAADLAKRIRVSDADLRIGPADLLSPHSLEDIVGSAGCSPDAAVVSPLPSESRPN